VTGTPPPDRCDLLVLGGTVVTVDDAERIHDPGAVAIVGDRIAWVGPSQEADPATAAATVDARGCAVIPGFVDCHTHLFQSVARSIGEGRALRPWLCDVMWPLTYSITADEAIAAVRISAVEAVLAGITTVMDNHYAPDDFDTTRRVVETIAEVGLRGIVARGMSGSLSPASNAGEAGARPRRRETPDELAITTALMDRYPATETVSVCPGPMNVTYVEPVLVAAAVELARERDSRWHTHCCEVAEDPQVYRKVYGSTPVQWLAAEGLLGPEATLAHAVWLDDADVETIGAARCGVAHNPLSNQYLASGPARWPDMVGAGVSVGLGTDGPACGHRMDPFETMKQAVLTQRLVRGDPAAATAADALRLATRGGAECLGVDAGVLEAGRLADLCVVGLSAPHLTPHHDVVAALVYSAMASDVVATVVGGRVVVEDHTVTTVDGSAAVDEAAARSAEAVARAGLTPRPPSIAR
jgi:5-methylthioadenosine/S-adenosylhomocysteine deaminase